MRQRWFLWANPMRVWSNVSLFKPRRGTDFWRSGRNGSDWVLYEMWWVLDTFWFALKQEQSNDWITRQIECARLADSARKVIEPQFPIMTARCDAKGSYDTVQCMNNQCFCTDSNGGLNGDESVNITKGLNSLPCCKCPLLLFWSLPLATLTRTSL